MGCGTGRHEQIDHESAAQPEDEPQQASGPYAPQADDTGHFPGAPDPFAAEEVTDQALSRDRQRVQYERAEHPDLSDRLVGGSDVCASVRGFPGRQ